MPILKVRKLRHDQGGHGPKSHTVRRLQGLNPAPWTPKSGHEAMLSLNKPHLILTIASGVKLILPF